MTTCGGTTSGYWAMGRAVRASSPTSVVMTAMTMANTGRRTKNSANMGWGPEVFGVMQPRRGDRG
jgi:hypothetical protein